MKKKKKAKKVKAKKVIPEKIDGLSPKDVDNIRKAIRQVWSWSHPRRLVVKRCLQADGFSKCETCEKVCAKVFIDHIEKVGDVDSGYIERLFVPSSKLQGMCDQCHKEKTKEERRKA